MDLAALSQLHPSEWRPVIFPALLALFCAGVVAHEWHQRKRQEPEVVWHPPRDPAGPRLAAVGHEPGHAELQAERWLAALHVLGREVPDPLDAWTPYHLGLCYDRLGRWREAETCYRAALEAEHGHRDATYNLARLLAGTQRVPEAIGLYRQLPEDVDALFNLGHLYFHLKLYPQAFVAWKEAKQRDPHALDVRVNLKLLARLRRAGEARPAA